MRLHRGLALIIAITLIGLLLTGCGLGDSKDNSSQSTKVQSQTEEVKKSETESVKADGENAVEAVNEQETEADNNDRKKQLLIGIAFGSENDDRWMLDAELLERQLQELGYRTLTTYAEDLSGQQEAIRELLDKDIALLIVAPVQEDGMVTVMDEVAEADIPVISYDAIMMNTDAIEYYVMFHHYLAGSMQGEFIHSHYDWQETEEDVKVTFTAKDMSSLSAKALYQGVEDQLVFDIDSEQYDRIEDENMDSGTSAVTVSPFHIRVCKNHGQKPLFDNENMIVYQDTKREVEVTSLLADAILSQNTISDDLTKDLTYNCYFNHSSYDNGTGIIPGFLIESEIIEAPVKEHMQSGNKQ